MIPIGAYTRRKIISILNSRLYYKLLEKTSFCGVQNSWNKNLAVKNRQYSTGDKQKAEITKSEGTSGEVSTTFETGR